jgi:hypothetical protein
VPSVKGISPMHTSRRLRARPLAVSDFAFIRRLASTNGNFTIPPPYVLWLLKRTNHDSCIVVEHPRFGPVAYVLSILAFEPRESVLYVWQLAASKRGTKCGAIDVALLALRAFVRRSRVKRVVFTMDPKSYEFRAVRRYVYALSGARVGSGPFLPPGISRHEREYVVRLA